MHTSTFDPPTLELRVLNGPQAGAALPLAGHDMGHGIILGSDRGCDVILQSPCIAPRHACLSITGTGFSATSLEGGIAAAEDAPATPPWRFGTAVYLGEIGITIQHCEDAWNTPAPRAGIPQQSPASTIGALLARPRQNWKRFTLLFAFLAIAAAGSQMVLGKHAVANAQDKLSPSKIQAINRIIARYRGAVPLETPLKLEQTPKGFVVHGYLRSGGEVNSLRRDLSEWQSALALDVHADDALLAAGRHFLNREQSPLKLAVVSGRAVLSGFEESREDVKRLAQDLKKNVPGLAGADATFVEQPRLEAWLRTWRKSAASSARPDETVHVETSADGILTLHGALSGTRIAQLKQALTQHSLRQNMLLAMRIGIDMSDRSSDFPPTVRAFSLGAVPYVFLSNGRRLMIGGDFDGFQLVAIKGQGPVFEKKGG